jgi:N-acetylglutamate synthase-like GNAT family acetyltransferase
MLTIKKANPEDKTLIINLLKELDLYYPQIENKNFLLAYLNQTFLGLAKLEECKNYYFLQAFGIIQNMQKQGLGSTFLKILLKDLKKPVYLYTIIPNFFLKNSFQITQKNEFRPAKDINLDCSKCLPEKCVCLKYIPK